ncbi:MAG: chromosome segregation protein SMC, partial [Myxococcota bacterium]
EISRRLGTLRRQAKKAERYKQLKAEIREIELRQAVLSFLELTTALHFERDHATTEQEELVSQEARVSELELRIEAARLGLADDDARLSQAQSRLYELDNAISLAEQTGEHANRSIEAGKKREVEALEETRGLEEALVFIAQQREELERGTQDLEAEASGHEDALAAALTHVAQLMARRSQRAEAIEGLRQRMLLAVQKAAEARGEVDKLSSSRAQLRERLGALEQELADVEHQLADREERAEVLTEQRIDAETARVAAEEERVVALEHLEQQKRELVENGRQVDEQRVVLGEKRSLLHSLEEIAAGYERSPEGVRALMARDPGAMRGVRGILADLFEASEDVEDAIEALLGARLQSLVVDDQTAALAAIDFLRGTEQGRVEVIVASALTRRASPSAATWRNARPLLDAIRVDDRHAELVASVLRGAYLVPNVDDAFACWSQAVEAGIHLVTSRGDVLCPDGTVRGGGESEAGSGLLRQKRQIRELTEEAAEAEERLSVLVAQREATAQRVADLGSRTERLAGEVHRLQLIEVEKRQELARVEDDRTRLRQRRDELSTARTRYGDESVSLGEQLELRFEERSAAEEERLATEEQLAQAGTEERALEEELHVASERATQLKVRAAAHQERRENLRQGLEHQARNERDVRGRLERLAQQVRETLEERERLTESIVESRARIEALLEERHDVRSRLETERATYEAAAAKVREQEVQARTARQRVDELRTRLNKVSIRLRERELELDGLSQRTETAYGLRPHDVVYDYHLLPLPDPRAGEKVKDLRRQVDAMGEINLTAIEESNELERRYTFLKGQSDDLTHALTQLEKAIVKINRTTKKRFLEAYESINENFQRVFPRLFRGGKAWLSLTDPNDLLGTGVEIYAQPPGKKLSSVALMSGGEQALTAVSLIFSIFLIKPSPFCLLDEVDAPLDEANVGRFNEMVKDVSNISQFIVITHNPRTMEMADQLYGVTMEEPGISKMVNVRMSAEA